MATEGEWRTVTRRKLSPANSNPAPPMLIQPFKPFHTQPSFADMVRKPSSSPPISTTPPSTGGNPSSKPNTTSASYISPHSQAKLRFPPSSRYFEWKGRCFQCCRMGHNAAHCRNPKRCGKCWGQGHIGSRCPTMQAQVHKHRTKLEPSFADLLENPIVSKPMPDDRPQKILVFVDRDDEYFKELSKLEGGAIILDNSESKLDLTIEQVVQYAARTNLVKAEDISVSAMSRARFVIMLPKGLAPDTFLKAIPLDVWSEGLSLYQWSPRDDAMLAMPYFKVLIDLVGIPLDLFREKEVIRATSSMGIFLGTVSQPKEGDIAVWTVAVATTSLSLIPLQIGYMVGGIEIPVDVIPKTWKHGPLYEVTDVAQPKERYKPIIPATSSPPPLLKEKVLMTDGEYFHISRSVLVDLCKGMDPMQLPNEVREVVLGPAMVEEQGAQMQLATVDPATQITSQGGTENLMSVVIGEGESDLNPSLEIVQDTNEAGQVLHSYNSPGSTAKAQVPQEISSDTNRMGCIPPSIPTVLKDQILAELSKNPPRILPRNKENFEIGDSSKSGRSAAKVVSIYSPPNLRPSTRNKRKVQENARNNRPKTRKRAPRQARIVSNSDGLVEVQVNYDHSSNLARILGFQTLQVQQALALDNEERAATVFEEEEDAVEDEQPTAGLNRQTRLEEKDGDTEAELQVSGINGKTSISGMEGGSGCTQPDIGSDREDIGYEHLTDFDPDSEDELSSASD